MPPSFVPAPAAMPLPDEAARQHSHLLQQSIADRIAAAGGWISFAQYMELALYAPGKGYYSSGAAKLGESGDFVTAPEISPLFGRTLARQAAQVLRLTEGADAGILEFGAGTGRLALDILLELEKLGSLPAQYLLLEVSADLQQRQQALFARHAPHLLPRIRWLDRLPDRFSGLILANEVLDAMPVHLVTWRDSGLYERGVVWHAGALAWEERALENAGLLDIAGRLRMQNTFADGYTSEISLAVRGFMQSLSGILEQGAILIIDYGFGESEYYHPQRDGGTLMCHYRHHAHTDPFYLPGLQDITAHVDFSAVSAVAGMVPGTARAGLDLLGYTTQARFLINGGITDLLLQTPVEDAVRYLSLTNQLQKLVSPAEMGELFKVIAFGKGIPEPLTGFSGGDMSRLL